MKILGIMQCMWARNPERVKQSIAQSSDPEKVRRRMIAYALFAGCRSGRVLKTIFGEELCTRIIWDESTREIANEASGVFPPDLDHIRNMVALEKPYVIITFGKVASDGVRRALEPYGVEPKIIEAPHPTARGTDTLFKLKEARRKLEEILKS